jgi:VCBS repeat-containing protein
MGRWNDRHDNNNDGDDTIIGGSRSDYLFGGLGDDSIEGNRGHDRIFGGEGDDALFGGSGNDRLFGGDGDDSIDGGEGCDVVDAGNGNDTINAGDHSDWVSAGDGDDLVDAGSGNDVVYGGAGNDTIDGGSGNDVLFGGSGNDVVSGGTGYDRIYAGSGNDAVDGGANNDTVYGGSGDDTIDGGEANDVLIGDDGNDRVSGDAGYDRIYGGVGNDELFGGGERDTVYGGEGDDTIDGGDGNDVLVGNDGNDQISGDAGSDRLYGGDGDDQLSGGADRDTVYGGRGNDAIDGGDGDDALVGDRGDDTISGGAGDDRIYAGSDDDEITGGDGADTIYAGSGDDAVDGGAGDDFISGSRGDDTLTGGAGNDDIRGSKDDDVIFGDGGDFADVTDPTELARNASGTFDVAGLDTVTFSVDFLGEDAGYDNSFGFYLADASGNPLNGRVIFAEVDRADDDAGEGVRTISLDSADLAGAATLGFFLIPDGDDRNWRLRDGDDITFQQNGDGEWLGYDNGRVIRSAEDRDAIFFSDPALNRDGLDHEVDNGLPGNSAWEDLLGGGDSDFDDATFDIHVFDGEFPAFNDTIRADKGDDFVNGDRGDDVIDGGKGDDTLQGGSGDDHVDGDKDEDELIYNASDNQGDNDFYDGGKGTDTLNLELTQNEAAALAGEASDFEDFIADNGNPGSSNGPSFEFDQIGLTARNFEALNITIINTNPDAVDDDVTTDEDTAVLINVLANDTDAEGDTLTITEVTQPANGTAQIIGNQILYTPADDFNGTDSFTYTIFDGFDGFDTATVNLIVNGVNDAPVAVDDTATVVEDTAGNVIDVLANDSDIDGDTLTVVSASALHGTVTINGDNTISYTSDPNYHGADTITYTISDGDLTDTAEVAVTVINDNADFLFTEGDDVVDFDTVTPFDADDGNFSNALGGNDTVILPSSQAEADEAGYDTGVPFNAGDGDDTITGQGLDDTILGGAGNDSLTGGTGDDSLDGGDGDDTYAFTPGDGDDTIAGSDGTDRVEIDLGDGGGSVRANADSIVYGTAVDPSSDRIDFDGAGAVEELDIQGGDGDDTIVRGTGPATNFDVDADLGAGDDQVNLRDNNGDHDIDLGSGNDSAVTGFGNDTIDGGDGDDSIEGRGGNNQLAGGAGNDTITGGDGDDLIDGGAGNDSLVGNEGDDTIVGGEGDDTATGGLGDDSLAGGNGNDNLDGGEGDDTIDGGADNDFLTGNEGSDSVTGGAGNDLAFGGDGDDTVEGGDGNDLIGGDDGNDSLSGDAGDDTIVGGEGDDTATGGLGEDSLAGGNGNDNLDGGEGDDTIDGGADNDFLTGNEGSDSVTGGAGNDLVFGGADDDTVEGGDGNDIVAGDDGNDSLSGDAGDDNIIGGEGNDTARGGIGDDNIAGGNGNDNLDGGEGDDTIDGGADNDFLTGNEGSDSVTGGAGNDLVFGGADDDTVEGGDGNDIVAGDDGNDSLSGDAGDDNIIGGEGNDTAQGGIGDDSIAGGNGNDNLDGGDGDDSLDGGLGDDGIDAGAGDDAVNAGDGSDTVAGGDGDDFIDGGDGNDSLQGGAGDDTLIGGEGDDSLDGGADNDSLDGGSGADAIAGGDGNDTINGGADNDTISGDAGDDEIDGGDGDDAVSGGDGDDTIIGGLGDDSVDAGIGNDSVEAGAGDDTVVAGDGDDFVDGDVGNDSLEGGAGDDTLIGGEGNDTAAGGADNDSISGGAGNDNLDGGDGNDTLDGGDGTDFLTGNEGDDSVVGGEGNDFAFGGDGNDTVLGGAGDDVVGGDDGNDQVAGGDGDDTVIGGDGNDTVSGDAGNDSLNGNDGDDIIDGGDGNDTINGGTGADVIDAGADDDSVDGGDGNDAINGAGGDDTINGGAGDDTLLGGDGDDEFTGGTGDDSINGGVGTDNVTFTGDSDDYDVTFNGDGTVTITDNTPGGDGTTTLEDVETATFNDGVFNTDGTNNAPEAFDDVAVTDEDTAVNIDVAANDVDFDSDDLNAVAATADNGTVVVEADGTITYTGNQDFNGTDTITYTVDDGRGGQDTGEVTVTVNAVNDAPVITTPGGGALRFDGNTANFVEVAHDPALSSASWTVEAWVTTSDDDGQFNRVLTKPVGGGQTYSLVIRDGEAHIRFDVAGVGQQFVQAGFLADGEPHHIAGVYDDVGKTLSLFVDGVLTGSIATSGSPMQGTEDLQIGRFSPNFASFGLDGDLSEVRVWSEARSAADIAANMDQALDSANEANLELYMTFDVTVSEPGVVQDLSGHDFDGTINGILSFVPSDAPVDQAIQTEVGTEVRFFGGAVDDVDLGEGTGQIQVTVEATNGAIDVSSGSGAVIIGDQSTTVTITGTLSQVSASLSNMTFTPDAGFIGEETLTITADDLGNAGAGGALTDVQTFTILVVEPNVAPEAGEDAATVDEDNSVLINVLANDTDDNGDPLTITDVTDPANGTAVIEGNQIRYTPDADFNGADSFTYTIDDGKGETDTATVNVTVNAVNDDPVIFAVGSDVEGNVVEDSADPLTDSGSIAFVDVDSGDTHTATANFTGAIGDLGGISAAQAEGFFGAAINGSAADWTFTADNALFDHLACDEALQLTYEVIIDDGNGGEAFQFVTVTVEGTNDLPRVSAPVDGGTTNEDAAPASFNLLANASDAEGDDLATSNVAVASDNGARNVAFSVDNSTGQITIDPAQFNDLASGASETLTISYGVIEEDRAESDTLGARTVPNNGGYYIFDLDAGTLAFEFNVPVSGNSFPGPANVPTNGVVFGMNPNNSNFGVFVSSFEDGVETLRPGTEQSIAQYAGGFTVGATSVSYANATNGADLTWAGTLDDGCGPRDVQITLSDLVFTDAFPGNLGVGSVNASAEPQATPATATLVVEGINDRPEISGPVDAGSVTEDDGPVTIDLLANASDPDGDDLDVEDVTVSSSNAGRNVAATVDEETGEIVVDPSQFNDLAAGESETVTVSYNVSDTTADFEDTIGSPNVPNGGVTYVVDFDTGDTFTFVRSGGPFLPAAQEPDNGAYLHLNPNNGLSGGVTVRTFSNGVETTRDSSEISFENYNGTVNGASFSGAMSGTSINWTAHDVATADGERCVSIRLDNATHIGSDRISVVSASFDVTADVATETTIEITGVNDDPDAVDDVFDLGENGVSFFNVLANDSDPDTNDVLAVTSIDGLAVSANGPATNFVATSANGGTGQVAIGNGGNNSAVFVIQNLDGFDSLGAGETDFFNISYTIDDGNGGTDTAQIQLNVIGENDGPVAGDDVILANEDAPITVDLLDNDSDAEDDTLTITSIDGQAPASGITVTSAAGRTGLIDVIGNGPGNFTFRPDGGFDDLAAGEADTINLTYTISDGNGGTDTADIAILVAGENDAPDAVDDVFDLGENGVSFFNVLANDSDPDTNDVLTVTSIDGLAVSANGPATNFVATSANGGTGQVAIGNGGNNSAVFVIQSLDGFDSLGAGETDFFNISYTIFDLFGGTDTAQIQLNVIGENDDVVIDAGASDLSSDLTAGFSRADSLDAADLLANFVHPFRGAALVDIGGVEVMQVGSGGSLFDRRVISEVELFSAGELDADTRVTITIDGEIIRTGGDEDIAFGIRDGDQHLSFFSSDGGTGILLADVMNGTGPFGVAASPTPTNDRTIPAGSQVEDFTLRLDLQGGNDSITLVEGNGQAFDVTGASGAFIDTDAAISVFIGSDQNHEVYEIVSLAFVAEVDGLIDSGSIVFNDADIGGTHTVSVTNVATTGDTNGIAAATLAGFLTLGTVTSSSGGSNGSVGWSFEADDALFEHLGTGESVEITYTIEVDDNEGSTDSETVTVTINGRNEAPTANDDAATTGEDTAVNIDVFGNDSDPDTTDVLTVTTANAANGTVVIEADNTLTYTPDADFNGSDTISYAISDGNGGTDAAQVAITVNAVADDAVIAGDTTGDAEEDSALTASGTLTVTDPDAGEDLMQAQAGTAGSFGIFSVDTDGNWDFVLTNNDPAVQGLGCDEVVTDSFIVTSADGTASETVVITVTGTNDLPVVSGAVDGGTTDEDAAPATLDLLANASDAEGDDLATTDVEVASSNAGRNVAFTVDDATGQLTVDSAQFGDLNTGESETLTITYGVIEEDRAEADTLGARTVPNNGGYYVFDLDTGTLTFEFNVPVSGNAFPGPANLPTNGVVFGMNPNNSNFGVFISSFEDGVETLRPGSEQSIAEYAGGISVGATSVSYQDATNGADLTWAATLDDGCGPRDVSITLSDLVFTDAFPGNLGVGGVNASADPQATPATATLVIEGVDDGPVLTNDTGFTGTENVPVFMDVLANDTGNDLRIVSAQAASGASVTFSGAIDDGLTLDPSGGNAGTLGFGRTISLDSLAPGDTITDIITFVVEDGAGNQAGDAVVTRQALDFRGQTISNVASLNQNGVTLSGSGNINSPNFNDLGITGGAFSTRLDAGEVLNLDFDHLAANVALFVGGTFNNTGINGGQISVEGFDVDGTSIGTQVINLGFGPAFGARISEVLGNVPLSRVEITGQGDSIGIESISFDEIQGDGFAIIEISGVNDAPVIVDQTFSVNEDDFGVFEQLTVDDPDLNHEQFNLTYNIVSAPAEGTTNIFDFGGPELEFTLDGGFQDVALGEVRDVVITYTATDPDGAVSDIGTITIQITGNNDAPVVAGETATLDEDTSINIDVLANDSDIDSGDVLTVSAASAGNGQVVIEADNSLTYTPDPDFTGSDTINYTVSDGNGGVVGGTVAVTVNPDDIVLFTANADTVDFDTVNGNDVADGNLTDALAGDDFVELPSNATEAAEAGFTGGIFFSAGDGDDTVIGGDDDTVVFIGGGNGDDSLVGGDTGNDLIGGFGNDTLVGGDGLDFSQGSFDDDLLFGGGDDDILEGGDGNDTIFGGDDNDNLIGGDGGDVLQGDAGNDVLLGETGDDNLNGGDGDDTLSGGAGADTLDGGAGRNFLSYASSDDAVSVNLGTGAASGGDAQGDVISNFQDLSGSRNALQSDTLIGNADENRIFGQDGGDNLQGGDGNDTLFGGAGADAHFGGNGFDFADFSGSGEAVDVDVAFQALGGDAQGDTFFSVEGFIGSGFDDRFIGNTVSESFQGGDGDDTIAGLQGDDTILGEDGNDQINGGGGNDQIFGGEGTGDLTGGDGNDLIIGGSGFDFIVGGNGDDTIEGGAGGDDMTAGSGTDVLSYAGSTTGVDVNLAAGSASGGDAAGDLFFGFENLTGSGAADALTGDGNANVIDGGAGNDSLDGGAGDDRFEFRTGDGNDSIDGFQAGAGTEDVIDFSNEASITGTGDLAIGEDGSGNATVGYGAGDLITLIGVDFNNLDGDDFQF